MLDSTVVERLILIAAIACASCSSSAPCAELGAATGLGAGASILRVQIFPASARCEANHVAAGATPTRIVDVLPSEATPIELPPGELIVHVSAYADAGATMLIAEGCASTAITSGETTCLPLPLSAPQQNGCTKLVHSNGLGQTYEDCAALGAHDARLATLACQAANLGATCETKGCSGGSDATAVCARPNDCTCWTYDGTGKGHVRTDRNCTCGVDADPSWN